MVDQTSNILQFLLYVGQVKRTLRTGWVLTGVEQVESVADHMYRMGIMSLLLSDQNERSKVRCLKMSLVHDLAESIVGDLTPNEAVTKEEKRERESEAMTKLVSLLPDLIGEEFRSLFDEYQSQETNEAKLVKDLDLFDMLLQAYEYEKIEKQPGLLQQFFDSSVNKVQSDLVRSWLNKLMEERNSQQSIELPEDSNLKTMLKDLLYDEKKQYRFKLPRDVILSRVKQLDESRQ